MKQKHLAFAFLISCAILMFSVGSCSYKPLTEYYNYTGSDTLQVDGEIWVRHHYGKRFITYEIDK